MLGLALAWGVPCFAPPVVSTAFQELPKELKEGLRYSSMKLVQASDYPPAVAGGLQSVLSSSGQLLRDLQRPQDGLGDVHIFLFESAEPTSVGLTPVAGKTYIGLSTGLLHALRNEDELSWVLASELEHVVHPPETYSGTMAAEKESLLARTIKPERELEALRRLAAAGRSPQAAVDLCQRISDQWANRLSRGEIRLSARLNVIAAAKALLFRSGEQTEFRLGGLSQGRHGFEAAREKLYGPLDFHRIERERARTQVKKLLEVGGVATPIYEWVKSGGRKTTEPEFETVIARRWYQIEATAGDFMTTEELVSLKMQLNRNLFDEFKRARESILGAQYVPASSADYDRLLAAEPTAFYFRGQAQFQHILEELLGDRPPKDPAELTRQLGAELALLEPRISAAEFLDRVRAHQKANPYGAPWWQGNFSSDSVFQGLSELGLKPVWVGDRFAGQPVRLAKLSRDRNFAYLTEPTTLAEFEQRYTQTSRYSLSDAEVGTVMSLGWKLLTSTAPDFSQGVPHQKLVTELLRVSKAPLDPAVDRWVHQWLDGAIARAHSVALLKHFDKEVLQSMAGLPALQAEMRGKVQKNIFDSLLSELEAAFHSPKGLKEDTWQLKSRVEDLIRTARRELPGLKLERLQETVAAGLKRVLAAIDVSVTDEEARALGLMGFPDLMPERPTAREQDYLIRGLAKVAKNPGLRARHFDGFIRAESLARVLLDERGAYVPEAARAADDNAFYRARTPDEEREVLRPWEHRIAQVTELYLAFGESVSAGERGGGYLLTREVLHRLYSLAEGKPTHDARAERALTKMIAMNPGLDADRAQEYLTRTFERLVRSAPDPVEGVARFWRWADDNGLPFKHGSNDTALSKFLDPLLSVQSDDYSRFALETYDLLVRGEQRYLEQGGEKRYDPRLPYDSYVSAALEKPESVRKVPVKTIARLAWNVFRVEQNRGQPHRTDALYEYLAPHLGKIPEVRDLFLSISFLNGLENRKTFEHLAQWQLSQVPGFDAEVQRLAGHGVRDYPRRDEVRPVFEAVLAQVRRQFPGEANLDSHAMVQFVEKKLVTSKSETDRLRPLRVGADKMADPRDSMRFDVLGMASALLEDPAERLKTIAFLIGQSEEAPDLGMMSRRFDEKLRQARDVSFRTRDLGSRAAFLQTFLSQDGKILEDPALRAKLKSMVLGPRQSDVVISTLYDTLLATLPADESPLILSSILAKYDPVSKRHATLRFMMEASGPLGGKASQKLVTSGILPKEERAELLSSFDDFLPPDRDQVHREMEQIFGHHLVEVESIGPLEGSGSVNYVVKVIVKDPQSGKRRALAVRVQKDRVAEKVTNEKTVWDEVSRRLKLNSDPQVRRAGRVISSVVNDTYPTLQVGGSELDMRQDQKSLHDLQQTYGEGADLETGLRVEVVAPDRVWQDRVPGDRQSRTLITEFISSVRLEDIESPTLRKAIANQIVRAELRALGKGVFDQDGHFRNWLIDLENGRLVRIDTSQSADVSPRDRQLTRELVFRLVDSAPGTQSRLVAFLEKNLNRIFEAPAEMAANPAELKATLRRILSHSDIPGGTNFIERIIFIQNELEAAFGERGGMQINLEYTKPIRQQLNSLFRLNLYREFTGGPELLAHMVGFAGMRYSRSVFSHVVNEVRNLRMEDLRNFLRHPISGVRTALAGCSDRWSLLASRRRATR